MTAAGAAELAQRAGGAAAGADALLTARTSRWTDSGARRRRFIPTCSSPTIWRRWRRRQGGPPRSRGLSFRPGFLHGSDHLPSRLQHHRLRAGADASVRRLQVSPHPRRADSSRPAPPGRLPPAHPLHARGAASGSQRRLPALDCGAPALSRKSSNWGWWPCCRLCSPTGACCGQCGWRPAAPSSPAGKRWNMVWPSTSAAAFIMPAGYTGTDSAFMPTCRRRWPCCIAKGAFARRSSSISTPTRATATPTPSVPGAGCACWISSRNASFPGRRCRKTCPCRCPGSSAARTT